MNKLYADGDDDESNGIAYITFLTISRDKGCSTKAGVSRGNFPVFSLAGAKQENEGKPFVMGESSSCHRNRQIGNFYCPQDFFDFGGFCFEAVVLLSRTVIFRCLVPLKV